MEPQTWPPSPFPGHDTTDLLPQCPPVNVLSTWAVAFVCVRPPGDCTALFSRRLPSATPLPTHWAEEGSPTRIACPRRAAGVSHWQAAHDSLARHLHLPLPQINHQALGPRLCRVHQVRLRALPCTNQSHHQRIDRGRWCQRGVSSRLSVAIHRLHRSNGTWAEGTTFLLGDGHRKLNQTLAQAGWSAIVARRGRDLLTRRSLRHEREYRILGGSVSKLERGAAKRATLSRPVGAAASSSWGLWHGA